MQTNATLSRAQSEHTSAFDLAHSSWTNQHLVGCNCASSQHPLFWLCGNAALAQSVYGCPHVSDGNTLVLKCVQLESILALQHASNHLALMQGFRCSKCEIKLEGEEPWEFPGAADDLEIIHTPGHTYGHLVLLHKPSKCGLLLSPSTPI